MKNRISFALVASVVFVGAVDLVRVDRLFCAPIDLQLVRGRNAAAEEISRRGNGTVCDLVEGGRGLMAWSFNAHGVGTTHELVARDTRFVWVLSDQVKRNRQLESWLQTNAQPLGGYQITQSAIWSASPERMNARLYQVKGVPPPPGPARPTVKLSTVLLGLMSLGGTSVALVCLLHIVTGLFGRGSGISTGKGRVLAT